MAKTRIYELVQNKAKRMMTFASFLLLVSLAGGIGIVLVSQTKGISADAIDALADIKSKAKLLTVVAAAEVENNKIATGDNDMASLVKQMNEQLEVVKKNSLVPEGAELKKLASAIKKLESNSSKLEKELADNETLLNNRRPSRKEREQLAQLQTKLDNYPNNISKAEKELEETAVAVKKAETGAAGGQSNLGWIILAGVGVAGVLFIVMINKAGGGIPSDIEENVFEPLKEVKKATKEIIKNGKLEDPIGYEGRDEVGDLIKSFNEMATVVGNTLNKLWDQEERNKESNRNLRKQEEKLWGTVKELKQTQAEMKEAEEKIKQTNSQLEHMNSNLDKIVNERTQALQETLTELKGTQNKMILSEKMAVLGQLVAGVAHEINSPLGAIKSSMANIKDSLPDLLGKLPGLVSAMNDEQRKLWEELQVELKDNKNEHIGLKEQREIRKQFMEILEDEDIDEADDIARNLIDAGFRKDLPKYLPLFAVGDAYDISRLIYQLGAMYNNTKNVELAITKTNKIVFTLKNYSRRQDDDVLIPVNLQESIETILVLYHNKIKHGIELTTNFEKAEPVMGNGDELGQIWTNIITNAVQAMGGKGNLEVKLWQDGKWAKVTIRDEGPGIPADIQEKIFEPFFTTKKKGEGTGLGLDICKKIIEKHGGKIKLESEPGKGTLFTIDLPVMTEEEQAAENKKVKEPVSES